MAATITAAQALQCMCTVDPLRSEKQIRSAMTKAFGKNALVANKNLSWVIFFICEMILKRYWVSKHS